MTSEADERRIKRINELDFWGEVDLSHPPSLFQALVNSVFGFQLSEPCLHLGFLEVHAEV